MDGEVSKNLIVPLSQRYASAWQEISQRIQSRQNANLTLFTVSFGIVPLYIFTLLKMQSDYSALGLEHSPVWVETLTVFAVLSIAISIISWAFSFWISHNDKTIGLLGLFCASIERMDNPNNDLPIPAWHDGRQNLITRALDERRLGGYATVAAQCVCGVPAIYWALQFPEVSPGLGLFAFIFGSSVILAAARVVGISGFRRALLDEVFEVRDGQANFFTRSEKNDL